jgi:adenosine 3'-phospho 5'-phosphosulfate transporter B3
MKLWQKKEFPNSFLLSLRHFSPPTDMTLIQEFGGIVAVLVGNARKAMTICLSFVFFPKPGSWYYVVGGVLVFGGLIANAFMKERLGQSVGKKEGQQEGHPSVVV